jgi:hypothetical protein
MSNRQGVLAFLQVGSLAKALAYRRVYFERNNIS